MRKLVLTWQHGALIVVVYGFFALLGGLLFFVAPIVIVCELLGFSDRAAFTTAAGLSVIWLPLMVGLMARRTSSEELKTDEYVDMLREDREWRRLDTARKYRRDAIDRGRL